MSDGGHFWPTRASDARVATLTGAGTTPDDVFQYLRGAGYTGSLDDMWKQYKAAQGITDISEPWDGTGIGGSVNENSTLAVNFEDGIVDLSSSAHTIIQNGDAARTTDQAYGGSYSGTATGSAGNYFSVAHSTEHLVDANSWTIQCAYRPATISGTYAIAGKWTGAHNTRNWLFYHTNADFQFIYSTGGSSPILSTTGTDFVVGTWVHLAVTYNAPDNSLRIYRDGNQVGSTTATTFNANCTEPLGFLGYSGGLNPGGYMDNLQIVKGENLYPSGMGGSPPTDLS